METFFLQSHFNLNHKTVITKLCTHLHPAPSTTIQLILTYTQLHSSPPSLFQPPPSSLQHPQQYLNQNIARNWAISPNLDRKIKSCQFWLKIGTHAILEVLILNPWTFNPKTHFWANLDPKIQSSPFRLKICTLGISRMLISFLGKFGAKQPKLSVYPENWHAWHLDNADSYSNISFLNFQP